MTIALIVALVAVTIAHIWLSDRKDKRATEDRQAHRLELAAVTARVDVMQGEHRQEIANLCQRIQAPEVAVIQHQPRPVEPENPYPLSDDESVEAQDERARVIAEIERMENEGLSLGFPGES